jgi:hypothetical protein
MAEQAKPQTNGNGYPPDPYPDYPPTYTFLFQSWLIMFLAVICIALLFYLYSFVRTPPA